MNDPTPHSSPEPVEGKTYLADGWVYKDIPWSTPHAWVSILEIIGKGNVVVLSVDNQDGKKRGRVLISPDGMANLKAFVELHGDAEQNEATA